MSTKSDFAFPTSTEWALNSGLTKLEWFAGQALIGLIVANQASSDDKIAAWAFAQAEAMILESEKTK